MSTTTNPTHAREIRWRPHDAQRRAYESDARFRVIAAGRRSGKTTLAAVETVERALNNSSNWAGAWVTPGHSITETGFRTIDDAVADAYIADRKQSPPYRHEFDGGGRLDYLSTSGNPNVSEGYDWILIDEAAKSVPEYAWTQELRPTLSNRNGEAMFISTPQGQGWFRDWWQRGQDPTVDDIASFQWTTYDADHIPDSEVDAARREMPDAVWRQEYLAEFDAGGALLTGEMLSFVSADELDPDDSRTRELSWTVCADLGLEADAEKARQNDTDYWAAAVVAYDSLRREAFLVDTARTRGMTKDQGVGWLRSIMDPLPTNKVGIEANQAQRWFVQDAQQAGLDAYGITNDRSKEERLTYLSVPFANGQVQLVNHDEPPAGQDYDPRWDAFVSEWLAFPGGDHDDLLDATEMAVRQLTLGGGLGAIKGGTAYGDA